MKKSINSKRSMKIVLISILCSIMFASKSSTLTSPIALNEKNTSISISVKYAVKYLNLFNIKMVLGDKQMDETINEDFVMGISETTATAAIAVNDMLKCISN